VATRAAFRGREVRARSRLDWVGPRDCDRSEPRQVREEAALRIARRSPGFSPRQVCDLVREGLPASRRGHRRQSRQWRRRDCGILGALGRIAQRESARFTRGRSLVRSQVRPLNFGTAQTVGLRMRYVRRFPIFGDAEVLIGGAQRLAGSVSFGERSRSRRSHRLVTRLSLHAWLLSAAVNPCPHTRSTGRL
jgi:hypothetical protein